MLISESLSTWGELLDRTRAWQPWLSRRIEGLEELSADGSVVVLLLDPRTDDFLSVTRSQRKDHGTEYPVSRIARDRVSPLDKVVDGRKVVSWSEGGIPKDHNLFGSFASVAAAPLRVGDVALGVVSIGHREDNVPYSNRILSEWAELTGEGFALRLTRVRQEGEHRWRLRAFKDMTTSAGDPKEVLRSLLGRGFVDGRFRIIGLIPFDKDAWPHVTRAHALEMQSRSFDQRRPVFIAVPAIGGVLRRTLEANQTVRVGSATRNLYLADSPELTSFMDARGLTEGLFSPVLHERRVSGAVFVLSGQTILIDDAVTRLEELAAMVSVVLHYSFSAVKAVERIGLLEDDLRKSRRHSGQLTDLIQRVLSDNPLHELTRRLARQINTPLLVEGQSFEFLSFAWPSGTPNIYLNDRERLLLSAPLRDPEARRSLQDAADASPYYLELPDAFPYAAVRVVMPVRINDEVVGYLSSLREDREPEVEADSLLALAASFVGLHMIRQQTTEEVRHRLSGELINDLLRGRHDESIMRRVRRLGYDLTPPYFLVVLLWRQRRRDQTASNPTAKMVMGLAADVVSRRYPGTLIGEKDGLVLFTLGTEDEASAVEAASRAISAVQDTFAGVTASACVSKRCSQLWDMEPAYAEAGKVLRLYEDVGGSGKVISTSHLGSFTALLQTDNLKELSDFATNWLRPLLAYDAEKDSSLVPTLHAYLRNWGHQRKTAEDLLIHVSTLKYRLQRIRDIGGLDLSDPETRTQAQLACQTLRAIDVLRGDEVRYTNQ